jgi:hypothetical protein
MLTKLMNEQTATGNIIFTALNHIWTNTVRKTLSKTMETTNRYTD